MRIMKGRPLVKLFIFAFASWSVFEFALFLNPPLALSQASPQDSSVHSGEGMRFDGQAGAEASRQLSPAPGEILSQLNDYPHAVQIEAQQREVIDHEVGLGMLKKVRGVWQFKASERQSGMLNSYTWQVVDGFTSAEVMAELVGQVESGDSVSLMFACEGRACGQGAQWANRIFRQRLLYGREDLQRYRVYALDGTPQYRLVMYSSARSSDRQYLHVELLEMEGFAP